MVISLIAALAAFCSVSALLIWASGAMRNPAEARLARLAPTEPQATPDAPFSDRVFIPALDGLARMLIRLLPQAFVSRVRAQLLSAGSPMTTQAFFTVIAVSAVFFPAAGVFLLVQIVGELNLLTLLGVGLAFAAGVMLPLFWLRRQVRHRKTLVWRRLSDVFDMITVSVEAGLGLDAALRQVSAKVKGPLSEEISLALRQIGMGRPRREALEDMASRIDVPEVTTFVNAIIQAEQLGTSLARVLRAQSVTIRVQRRQRAEETARRAPVKMVFPLVLFIMPTFFIITLGPIFVLVVENLGD